MVVCGGMIHRLHLQSSIKAQVIGHPGQFFPEFVHVRPALPGFAELKRTLHIVPLARTHCTLLFTRAVKLLEVQLFKLGLRVKGINVGRPAFHVKEDAMLGLGQRKMGLLPARRSSGLSQHRSESNTAKTGIEPV